MIWSPDQTQYQTLPRMGCGYTPVTNLPGAVKYGAKRPAAAAAVTSSPAPPSSTALNPKAFTAGAGRPSTRTRSRSAEP
jgi:hypothetical protein